MSSEDNGGPAFPCEVTGPENMHQTGSATWQAHGLSVRDYFIAHAPAEPQHWFKPVMPHPCPEVTLAPLDMTNEEREEWRGYVDDMIDVEQIESARLAAHVRSQIFLRKQRRDWADDFAKQLYVQWPAAWADEMLKARQT